MSERALTHSARSVVPVAPKSIDLGLAGPPLYCATHRCPHLNRHYVPAESA
jgi:hypothetical protein